MTYLWFYTAFGVWLLEGTYLSLFQNVFLIVILCGQLAFMNTMDDIPMVLYCLWCMVSGRDIFVPLKVFL